MTEEKKENKTLFEDMSTGSNNYLGVGGGQGQSAMQLKPGKVTLMDLLKQANEWEQEMGKAPNRLPYPLQDGLSERLGDLFVSTSEIKNTVEQSAKHSIIRDNKQAIKSVKAIHDKLTKIEQIIKAVVQDIDGLSVGTSAPPEHA
jgi:hypothetical protein